MNMTTEHSTYTYEGGAQETVTLRRGTADPHGHALLRIDYSDGRIAGCYVNTAWLRDRLDDLNPRPLTPDAITDEMVERAVAAYSGSMAGTRGDHMRDILTAALTPPPATLESIVDEALTKYTGGYLNGDQVGPYVASKYADLTEKDN